MKKSLLAVALAAMTAMAAAQTDTVTFTKVLDTTATGAGTGSVYAATYVPGENKFVSSKGGLAINIFNGDTGAYETDMSLSGISIPDPLPTGVFGLFALTATEDGVIYGMEDNGNDLWRWAGTTDTEADNVYDNAGFYRVGYTGTVGTSVTVAFTGQLNYGPVDFFSDTFPFSTSSFAFNESIDLDAKSSLAINNDGTVAFTVGDLNTNAVMKWVKTDGTWGATPAWINGVNGVGSTPGTGTGGGPMAYDNTHDILFLAPAPGSTKQLLAIDGADGTTIGQIGLESALSATTGYCGGFAVPSSTGGTVYLVGRAGVAGDTVMYVYDYVVEGASVNDWSLYQQ